MLDNIRLSAGRLNTSQISRYWDQGYLSPLPALSPQKITQYRAELEALEAKWLDNGLPLPLNTYKRVNAQFVMPIANHIAAEPAILDLVEDLLGPDILLYSVEFFIKEAHSKHIVSMHQDLTYWGLGAIDGLLTAWIALSPATRASGCMEFVAASHKNAILPHEDTYGKDNLLSRGQEVRVDVADTDKTAIELAPGQMSLHHGLTIHGSGPNTSDDRRIGVAVRYMRPDLARENGTRDYAILVRGQDRFDNFHHYTPPSRNFAPDDLEKYDEIRVMQARVIMAGAKDTGGIYGQEST